MKSAQLYLKLCLLLAACLLTRMTHAAQTDTFYLQPDEFFMLEGETKSFNFISNDDIPDMNDVTITLTDTAGKHISYLGNGAFSIFYPIIDSTVYIETQFVSFEYKAQSISDPGISKRQRVTMQVKMNKKNHRVVRRSIMLNQKLNLDVIPLPDNFSIIACDATIYNKASNTGKTKLGEYKMDIVLNGNILPLFSYSTFYRSGRDTFQISVHDTILNEYDTTQYIVSVLPISNENDRFTRWFYKNSPNPEDTITSQVASSDSIVSFCDGQLTGSSIYGNYRIADGFFYYHPTYFQAGMDSVCVRGRSGNTTYFYFITVIEDVIRLRGQLYVDKNENCVFESGSDMEAALNGFGIRAYNSRNEIFYGQIDAAGVYQITVPDTGSYQVRLSNNPFVAFPIICPATANITSSYFDSSFVLDIGLGTSYNNCIFPVVDISTTTNFRRCRTTNFYIKYANLGTETMEQAYVDVRLEKMDILYSTIPYTQTGHEQYRFDVGNLEFGKTGNIAIEVYVHCDSTILGQTLCAEAHLYPDDICTEYTGPVIRASAECLGDSVRFRLQNNGSDMTSPRKYIVIQDNVMRISKNYQLEINETLTETLQTEAGSTYRIIAEQFPGLPETLGDPFTTAALENCKPVAEFSTGFFTQFPNYDGEPFRSVSCNPIIGSYDPNDKVASPTGYSTPHYIEANTAINYQINFQNTGNDTAFRVVVVDTIAATLDINSIEAGVSSHAYTFQRLDSNVIAFVFDDINLVDSNRNEALSHGFVKFRINQQQDLTDGTIIYNRAAIYFDFNAPIITNSTYHTIGREFIEVNLISKVRHSKYQVQDIAVFPNPFRDRTQIIIKGEILPDPVLHLMNMEGRIIRTIKGISNAFEISRDELANGFYLFRIMQGNEHIADGKLIAQ
ncbi:MAG: hypothetical protein RL222_1464 [Bacteroidota bacterium]|jgi:uncharacterized repeat protein (TIGR01451 family)